MKYLIRAAFTALSLATITPVASAATTTGPSSVHQINVNDLPGPGWG